jgi:hypothetical protein
LRGAMPSTLPGSTTYGHRVQLKYPRCWTAAIWNLVKEVERWQIQTNGSAQDADNPLHLKTRSAVHAGVGWLTQRLHRAGLRRDRASESGSGVAWGAVAATPCARLRAVLRAVLVLNALPPDGSARELTDIARDVDLSPSTTHSSISSRVRGGITASGRAMRTRSRRRQVVGMGAERSLRAWTAANRHLRGGPGHGLALPAGGARHTFALRVAQRLGAAA